MVMAAGLEEVARTSGAVQRTTVAASGKRRLWKESQSPQAGCSCCPTPGTQ